MERLSAFVVTALAPSLPNATEATWAFHVREDAAWVPWSELRLDILAGDNDVAASAPLSPGRFLADGTRSGHFTDADHDGLFGPADAIEVSLPVGERPQIWDLWADAPTMQA